MRSGEPGELLRRPHDWSDEVRGLRADTLLVSGDADSIPPTHMAEFFALLGGGQRDAGWDGSVRPRCRLAVIPGRTHYDIFQVGLLPGLVRDFLDAGAGSTPDARSGGAGL